jgi:pilus assembly protein CpaF
VDNLERFFENCVKVFDRKGKIVQLKDRIIGKARDLALDEVVVDVALQAFDAIVAERESETGFLIQETELLAEVSSRISGFGVLQQYFDDDSVEEIWLNQPNEVFVSRNGTTERLELSLNADEIKTLVFRLLRESGRRLDRVMPFVDASLPDGSRLHVAIPEATSKHWAINIRKFRKSFRSLDDLSAVGMLNQKQARFLSSQIRQGKSVLVAGATQAGKTTFLNALLNELDTTTRVISCEETFEISSNSTDWVALQTRQANLEGNGEFALRRLVKESLRMRPEFLAIGEVREAEAFDLLIAMNSGIPGASTIHANSAQFALDKLCTLPLLVGPNISLEFTKKTVVACLDLVVFLGRKNGKRALLEIAEVAESSTGSPTAKVVAL